MSAQRLLFLTVSIIIALKIKLSGVERAHWVLYIPAVFLGFAGITGICPGLIFWRRLGFK